MWISVPMPVTTSSIIPESGSSRNPQGIWNFPTAPSRSSIGMTGIHWATVTSYARASPGRPSKLPERHERESESGDHHGAREIARRLTRERTDPDEAVDRGPETRE